MASMLARTENILSAFSKVRRIGRARHDDLKTHIDTCENLADRVSTSLPVILAAGAYVKCAKTFVDQIRRRALLEETILHDQKIFSVFEPYERWISKGKAGCPAELGVPIFMLADRLGFVLYYEIMREGADMDQSVPLAEGAQKKHVDLQVVSFDRGFHSPENRKRLEKLLDCAALPKKGRPSEEDKAR